ncbi:MAG: hypothetical protein NDI61_06235 [Bdellovibrionaceae bacterium]|nr:hypothetical protein [Pseudobdellovibrionaceae bacterium]
MIQVLALAFRQLFLRRLLLRRFLLAMSCVVGFSHIEEVLAADVASLNGSDKSRCYRFAHSALSTESSPPRDDEFWCYRRVEGAHGGMFVYSVGQQGIPRPEFAAFLGSDGRVVHVSRVQGRLTWHSVDASEVNPLPVPLSPPDSLSSNGGDARAPAERVEIAQDARGINELVEQFVSVRAPFEDLRFGAAPLSVYRTVPPDVEGWDNELNEDLLKAQARRPWRGYWWPYSSSRLSKGSESPLAKYDRFVRARGGISQAQAWEKRHHQFRGLKWEGHCNGWAGSAILRPEPDRSIHDLKSGVTFRISDLKGLWAERDACVKYTIYGKRYRGRSGDNRRDIEPKLFHQTVSYYIGRLRKPIVMDHFQDKGVDNHIVSGYAMTVEKSTTGSVTVTARLKMHRYDKEPSSQPGSAPAYTRIFKYSLKVDPSGQILGGNWLSKNPDFLWVPLGVVDCSRKNPFVQDQWLNQIFSREAESNVDSEAPESGEES